MRYDPLVFIFARFLLTGVLLGIPTYFLYRRIILSPIWIRLRHRLVARRRSTIFLQRYYPPET